ncbi:MAG: phosphoenolpyruvate--protein phosphotransferase [Acidobacteria bacterium]|nr:phosphoenolpyruvate--protein phosphotransferase [Acidobacteriota bacterium]
MLIIKGVCVSPGVAMGPLRFLKNEPLIIRREKTDDVENEAARFEKARTAAYAQLDELYREALNRVGEESAAIFEIHKMMLDDPDFRESVTDMIRAQSMNAEYAVSLTAQKFAAIFSSMDNAYMKSRAADVFDISERVQKALNPGSCAPFVINAPSILAARDIAPSEAVQLDKNMILGFATAEGTDKSHVSILAGSMGIPAVIGMGAELAAEMDGKTAILDGFTGTLYVEPDDAICAMMSNKLHEVREKREALNALKGRPNVTPDGRKIDIFANVNTLSGLDEVIDNDAGGIGLFRSEFLYLGRRDYPTEEEQFAVYKRAAEIMDGKKVVIRTLDIGADKRADYFNLPHEENPAMGLRAIRLCLTRPEIFKTQLRALYRASAFGNIAIMFPMIISAREVEDILKITEDVKADLRRGNVPFNEKTERGIMIETPAAVMTSGELAKMADFFSIGTNDLSQYTLAIDRQNRQLDRFYDPHHPAVLKMIEMTVKSAHDAGIWVGICGELGADLELTETFLRMGVDELSVSAGMVLPLREKILSLDSGKSPGFADRP